MKSHAESTTESVRRQYAEELCSFNRISSTTVLAAFATVPRERFVGPGPWTIQREGESWTTRDGDPRHVYRDALIVLDRAKHLNNGQPSLWASHLAILDVQRGDHVLHLGCGTGYYTAILGELTGPLGTVTAIEIDHRLASHARAALESWPQVRVIEGDGARGPFEPFDVIVVSAGATHPLAAWLGALKPGGKLLFPLTATQGPGTMSHLIRVNAEWFQADLIHSAFFVDFAGARDPAVSSTLAKALKRDQGIGVRSLRCDRHQEDRSCWLHGNGWCYSRQPAQSPAQAM
jgi:protein-L-isoaspartate(D-aspartate) O-methyltransferase